MNQRPFWRPENAMVIAVLLIGGAIFVAGLLIIAGVVGGGRPESLVPYGIAMVVAAGIAAVAVLGYSRKLRRQQRPEWLETQAWRQGLIEKLQQGEQPGKPGDRSA